jgi:hypothetical protein
MFLFSVNRFICFVVDASMTPAKARDDLLNCKAKYASVVKFTDGLLGSIKIKCNDAADVLASSYLTEFENWIIRIAAGGGGTKTKDPHKAMQGKHLAYMAQTEKKRDPAVEMHKSLWRLAEPLLHAPVAQPPPAKKARSA